MTDFDNITSNADLKKKEKGKQPHQKTKHGMILQDKFYQNPSRFFSERMYWAV